MKFKKIALVGYTGLIGSNFLNQLKKKIKIDYFNSKNILKIKEKNIMIYILCCITSCEMVCKQIPL